MKFGGKMKTKIFLILVVFCMVIAPIMAEDGANLIVPGKCIGPVYLGATESAVQGLLGKPQKIKNMEEDVRWIYNNGSFVVDFTFGDKEKEACYIYTTSNKYKTDKGISVGVSKDDLLKAYGTPAQTDISGKDEWIWYSEKDNDGFEFVIIEFKVVKNKIAQIGVLNMGSWW